jgi:hypothetical protein
MITYNQCQSSSALRVDEEQSRNSRHDLDGAVAQGGVQGLDGGITDILEDGRTVERDDCKMLDTTID